MKKHKHEDLEIKKEFCNFLAKKEYIQKSTSKINPYRMKFTSPLCRFALDMYILFKNNDIIELQQISKEIIEDSKKNKLCQI